MASLGADSMMSWRFRAACIGQPIELFFQDRGRNDQARRARAICSDCPVRSDCLDFAMSFPDGELPGIYGGLTEGERRKIR